MMKDTIEKKVNNYIREHDMLAAGDRAVVGVSGGADSICLLHLLASLQKTMEMELLAVHVHHGLRGEEAERDARFVEAVCRSLAIPCVIVREDVETYAREQGLSLEEAGRNLRYRAFRKAAEGWKSRNGQGRYRIAVAHQKEDQVETILHNLFRGSGLRGLSGMAPVRGEIIRPLLCVGRQEVLDYLEENQHDYCVDSTNETLDYTRNKLRNYLIPEICREINNGAAEHIRAAGEKMAEADAYFEAEARQILNTWGREKTWSPEEGWGPVRAFRGEHVFAAGIPGERLLELPHILGSYVIRGMLECLDVGLRDITGNHVDDLMALVGKGTGRKLSLPGGLIGRVEYGMLWLERPAVERGKEENHLPSFTFNRAPYEKTMEIPQKTYTKWFDYDKIKGTLIVRTRQTGDYITLKDGKTKTVKAFMIDEKIPRQQRDRIPLLADGSHILWIVGYRISEYYKVSDTTKEILKVQMDGGNEHGRQDSGSDF